MDQLKALPLGRQLILGAGVLLFIDSLFHWRAIGPYGENAWNGFWGIFMCLMLIALVAWTAARAFGVTLPDQVPDGLVTLALGVLIPLFALIKAISDSYVHWPAWVGVILGAVIAYGAWQVFAASGEKLSSMPARDTSA
jgi:hypothetical protein